MRQTTTRNDKLSVSAPDAGNLKEKAYKYYLKGLAAWEIAKLLDVSTRTVQRLQKEYDFAMNATPMTLQERAISLKNKGHSYTQIAKALKISKSTVYNYLKAVRQKQSPE